MTHSTFFRQASTLCKLLCLIVLISTIANAQDPLEINPKLLQVVFQNEIVRVIRAHYEPNDSLLMHHHPKGILIGLTDVDIRSTDTNHVSREIKLKSGSILWHDAMKHAVMNINTQPLDLIEIELNDSLNPRPFTVSRDPMIVDSIHSKLEIDNKYLRVFRFILGAHERSPMHDHPRCITVNLTDLHINITTPDGKSIERSLSAGQVQWNNAMSHAVENLSDKPLEVVFVELKAPPVSKK